MRKHKFILIFSTFMFLFNVHVSASQIKDSSRIMQNNSELKTLLQAVNEEHRSIQKTVIDFEQYIENFSINELEYEKYQEAKNEFNTELILNKKSISADIDVLFSILETTYGGYYYFGGDKAFGEAKDAILKECNALDSVSGQQLDQIIRKHLSIIKDSHFTINDSPLSDYLLATMYTGADFIKDGKDFKNLLTGKKVVGIKEQHDWQNLFKRFISESGDLVYRPVIYSDNKQPNITVQYEDSTEQLLKISERNSNFEFVSLSGFGDIPVIRCPYTMGFDQSNNDAGAKLFLEYAKKYSDEPVLIVDIRNNGGGNGILPMKWFMEYAGEFVPNNYSTLKYMSDEKLRINSQNKDNQYYIPYEELTDIGGFTPISESYIKSNAQPDKFVKNDQLLIILVNKNTASSSESFVDMAHNIENTLIVGTNTGGCLVGDAFTWVYLPNSGIKIRLGAGISFFPENYFEEYKGFEPDLWVDGNAEEMIYRFLYK